MHAIGRTAATAGLALVASSAVAVAPIAPPTIRDVASPAVRLLAGDGLTDAFDAFGNAVRNLTTGGLGGLTGDLGSNAGLGGLDSLTAFLAHAGTDFSTFLDGGVGSLNSALGLNGITSGIGNSLTSGLAGLLGASGAGGLGNIPYNVLADIINVPYNEGLALQEYASALGPAGNLGGVPGWIPPGTPAEGISYINSGLGQYALGGTGSYYAESMGNTWGWDNGNFPQLDGIASGVVPFPSFEQPFINQIQSLFQSEAIAGAVHNCEFECASVFGYLGNWFHTPLTSLLSPGHLFPETIQGDVTAQTTFPVTWFGQPGGQLNPLAPFEGLFGNGVGGLTASPATNPIEILNPLTVLTNYINLNGDAINDFDPFIQGSFTYWGAPTDYSIPAVLGGTLQDLTGIPNQFGWPTDQLYGAEPVSGLTAGPSSLLTGLPKGLEYLLLGPGGPADGAFGTGGAGLLGYLNPETYLAALTNLLHGQFPAVLGEIPLLGFVGLPEPSELLASLGDPSGLLGSLDPSTLGSLDLSGLLNAGALPADLSALLNIGTLPADLSGLLNIGALPADLSELLPNLTALIPF